MGTLAELWVPPAWFARVAAGLERRLPVPPGGVAPGDHLQLVRFEPGRDGGPQYTPDGVLVVLVEALRDLYPPQLLAWDAMWPHEIIVRVER